MADPSDASYQILIALRRIIRAIDLHSKQLEKEFGLTVPQLLLLKEIGVGNVTTSGALAVSVSLSQATVTSILDRLEAHGMIRRRRSSEDKRVVYLDLTDAARSILDRNPSILQEHFVSQLNRLEEWEQLLILSSFRRVSAMMEADRLEVNPLLVGTSDSLPQREGTPSQ